MHYDDYAHQFHTYAIEYFPPVFQLSIESSTAYAFHVLPRLSLSYTVKVPDDGNAKNAYVP